jgi:hypothetical protein
VPTLCGGVFWNWDVCLLLFQAATTTASAPVGADFKPITSTVSTPIGPVKPTFPAYGYVLCNIVLCSGLCNLSCFSLILLLPLEHTYIMSLSSEFPLCIFCEIQLSTNTLYDTMFVDFCSLVQNALRNTCIPKDHWSESASALVNKESCIKHINMIQLVSSWNGGEMQI